MTREEATSKEKYYRFNRKMFLEIINTGTETKPYYEIKYLDVVTNVVHIGYSSYDLRQISEYLINEFC